MSDITVKRQIDQGYRSYALHVIESRGIPNWYDSITNGQRILIDNCPSSFTKTLSVVGSAISAGYHSGDASLVSTINKLARQFNCAEPVMIGDGFFGCPVSPSAASARYTSVKMNPRIKEITGKYYHLNQKNEDGVYDNFAVDVPMGLCSGIMGIAVGYKSTILPRKLSDVQDFMAGKRKRLSPYFMGFDGSVSKYGDDRTWLIEGTCEVNEKDRTIRVTSIPPMLRFDAFLRKLSSSLEGISYKFRNDSSDLVDVLIVISKSEPKESWERCKASITKATKLVVHESVVFIRDRTVVEYERLEDYLLDFSENNEKTLLRHLEWSLQERSFELRFLEAKLKYMLFVMEKKRAQSEMDEFLSKYEQRISSRLDSLKIRMLNTDEVERTRREILEKQKEVKDSKELLLKQKEKVSIMKFELRGKRIKPSDALFSTGEMNGIEIFSHEEEQEDEVEI